MPAALPWQKRPPSLFARILAWCNGRVRAIASFAHRRLSSAEAIIADAGSSGDRNELASNDPLLFRELQARCTLCRSKERCVLDLAQECGEPGNREWREYCLNATTLNALGAVQNCARAAQYLRTPRSTGYLADE